MALTKGQRLLVHVFVVVVILVAVTYVDCDGPVVLTPGLSTDVLSL
jgi:hypothetical protein